MTLMVGTAGWKTKGCWIVLDQLAVVFQSHEGQPQNTTIAIHPKKAKEASLFSCKTYRAYEIDQDCTTHMLANVRTCLCGQGSLKF